MPRPVPSLDVCKRNADFLLKDLHSTDPPISLAAVERFRRIAPFRDKSSDEVYHERNDIQHKHALAVIARECGFAAWKNLKDAADVMWCPPHSSAYWHNWCKTHEEARAYLEVSGGYLLTGHGKWFIAERGYIESLGLDADDPRWGAIGFDIYAPRDKHACEELIAQRKAAIAR